MAFDGTSREKEFRSYVWNHSVDPFQTQFDERRPLTSEEADVFTAVHSSLCRYPDDRKAGEQIQALVYRRPERLLLLLQLAGLTRSKIISDLKGVMGAGPRGTCPSSYEALAGGPNGWAFAGPYLASRLRKIIGHFKTLDPDILEGLNQATWPGFVRQERAKRSGHQGEYRLAALLASCGIPFIPAEKADNPLCPDVQLNGISFDIVVPHSDKPLLCVKATVHTSNIGQFGESKDALEMTEARAMLDQTYPSSRRPKLVALVDGVGMLSNRAGLTTVLKKADEFMQYRTIWKAVVLSHRFLSQDLLIELPASEQDAHADFLERNDFAARIVSPGGKHARYRIAAGDAAILLEELPKK